MTDKTLDTNSQEPVTPSPAPGSARRQFIRRGAAVGAGAVLTVHHQRSFADSGSHVFKVNGKTLATGQFIVSSAAMCNSLAAKNPGVTIQNFDDKGQAVVVTGSFGNSTPQLCAVNPPTSNSGSSHD